MSAHLPRRRVAVPLALALALGGFLGACGDSDGDSATTTTVAEATTTAPEATTTTAEGELSISGAWARTSAKVASAGAVYLEITNSTEEDDALVDAAVDPSVAKMAQLHETKMAEDGGSMGSATTMSGDTSMSGDGGMMTMAEVEEIPIKAGETVSLKPGGYHVMLMELTEPLVAGEKVELTLTFAKAGDRVVEAEVRDTEA